METQTNQSPLDMSEWFNSDMTVANFSAEDFDKFVNEYLSERVIAEEIEARLTEQNKKLMAMQGKLMEFLEQQGKEKHVTSMGTIARVETTQYRAPEGEGREAVVQYLKDTGKFDNVVAFNVAKFSSWYKAEKETNPSFDLAGVEQKVTKYIRFNKAKGN